MAPSRWIPVSLSTLLLMLACGGGNEVRDAQPSLPGLDGGVPDQHGVPDRQAVIEAGRGDSADPCRLCTVSQVCKAGACVDLPATCPCPPDSYCDLGSNTCKPGCTLHDHCSQGKYCDADARECRPGCRTTAECKDDGNPCTDQVCTKGQCLNPPNTSPCADDGNPCTIDVCLAGKCTHPARPEGTACGTGDVCSKPVCQGGQCVTTHPYEGMTCANDSNSCTSDVCAQGKCTHPILPDKSTCPGPEGPGAGTGQCLSAKCIVAVYACINVGGTSYPWQVYARGTDGKFTLAGSTQSCACYGSSFSAGTLSSSCALCENKGGGGTSTQTITCYK